MAKQKTIGIFAPQKSLAESWDPDSLQTGVAGSEEAIIYISEELARLGYKVLIMGKPPKDSRYSDSAANPRYVDLNQIRFTKKIDIAISWRHELIGWHLKSVADKVYLWPHDIICEPISSEQLEAFDDVLWLSEWQRQSGIAIHPEYAKYTHIFGNGIDPTQFKSIKRRANPYSCIYGSNYSRGLEVLLELWPEIKKHQPKATLDIYYGWQSRQENGKWLNWQGLPPEKEEWMRRQMESLPAVREHGRVGHVELNKAYASASFWTYPCLADETFCISGLRAQFSGAIPVIIEGSALYETVRHGYKCMRKEDYLKILLKAFDEALSITLDDRRKMGEFILQNYTWEKIALEWAELFERDT